MKSTDNAEVIFSFSADTELSRHCKAGSGSEILTDLQG